MTTIYNIRMGKVKVGDRVIRCHTDQPYGHVTSIEPDGTDVVVTGWTGDRRWDGVR